MNDLRSTRLGTPWASTWDESWVERIESVESALERRICGARTLSGEPCTLTSNHRTGRCRYHGGTDAIGAPVGNQNARTHGLYARRLQRCGTHCPMWEHCPFAGDDVLALEPKERPICAYESAEYEGIIGNFSKDDVGRDALPRVYGSNCGPAGAGPSHSEETGNSPMHHNLALMQVMLSRAASALSITALTDTTTSESERYQLHTTKMHPALYAFLRISRELRALHKDAREMPATVTASDQVKAESPADFADLDESFIEEALEIRREAWEAEGEQEEYTRRLEWIVHDKLGADWREFESIRVFALPRATPVPGMPTHDPRIATAHPPPNEHPMPLRAEGAGEYARPP